MVWVRKGGSEYHEEWCWGEQQRVIRLYISFPQHKPPRLRLDLSQVRDRTWPLYKALVKAYGPQPIFDFDPVLRDQLMNYIAQEDLKLQKAARAQAPWYAQPERVVR